MMLPVENCGNRNIYCLFFSFSEWHNRWLTPTKWQPVDTWSTSGAVTSLHLDLLPEDEGFIRVMKTVLPPGKKLSSFKV